MTTIEVAGDGVALFYGAIILLVLSWVTFTMRAGVRLWRKALGVDDYFMLIGIVSSPALDEGNKTDLTLPDTVHGHRRSMYRMLLLRRRTICSRCTSPDDGDGCQGTNLISTETLKIFVYLWNAAILHSRILLCRQCHVH